MNASSSMDKKRAEAGDDLLLPPKQTEWRRYSKTLIEELKEKLEDRRAKTLALLSENKDLSAFQEIDTESDGLDDTSTNATSKHDDRRSGNLEMSSEQVLVLSSQSEASSLTDSDCCARHRYCASSADVGGVDGVCTHSSYSMTSSNTTDDEGQSISVRLSPPRQDSVVTMTSLGCRWQPGEENLLSIPYNEKDVRTKCMCVNKSACTHGHVSTAYMVRRSSSHCCLNTTSPVVTQNFNVRLSRSYTYLGQDVDYELPYEMTYPKVSCFADVARIEPATSSCVPIKGQYLTSAEDETCYKEPTDIEHAGSIRDKRASHEITYVRNATVTDGVSGGSQVEESLVMTNSAKGTSPQGARIKQKVGVPHQDACEKYGDSLSLSEKACAIGSEPLDQFEGGIDLEKINKQCGDMEGQIKTAELLRSKAECFDSDYIGRVTTELDYLQRKMMLEEICDVIKSSIAGDVDRRLILELKQKIDQCSVSLNVSGNSGYVTSQQASSGLKGGKKEMLTIPVTDPCSTQLKKCLEKAHLASLLQKEMGQAKSNIATLAAKRAYEKAIGDFDIIVNDYLKSETPQDSLHDEQNKADLVASFRRSETFIIDKNFSLQHSSVSKQFTSPFVMSDTGVITNTKSGEYNGLSAGNVADDIQGASGGKYNDEMPPKSSPTFLVSQNTSEALGKRKRKKSGSRPENLGKVLTGNKMQDTNAFVMKHFGSGTRADSESDSSDSLSDAADANPFKYTSSMLAQLLDYDSQDEKLADRVEHLDLALKQNEQSIDDKGGERSLGQLFSKDAVGLNAKSENIYAEQGEENLVEADNLTLEEANVNYDSDFNAGSISECIQEEERSCDEDNDVGLCFNTSDRKDVDSETFNVDRPMDSKDCSDMELNMNEETPMAKEISNIQPEMYGYSEDFEMRDETNDAIDQIDTVDVKRCYKSSLNIDNQVEEKQDIIKDIFVTQIQDSQLASNVTNYFYKIDVINGKAIPPIPLAEGRSYDGQSEDITSAIVVPDVYQSVTVGLSTTEAVSTCDGSSGTCCSKLEKPRFDQANIRKLKKTGEKVEDSNRPQFIPMVEWSSSEEDIFEDLTRDKSPSDILRQKQKEIVDEKLKQLTQMSKRRRKSRSPVSYKIPQNSVNLETLLDGKAREENQDAQVGTKNYASTSLRFVPKHIFAVLKSPLETQKEPECVQPSVSDLLLARLNEEEFNSTSEERSIEKNEDTVLQTEENFLNSCQISRTITLKDSVSPSKVARTQEPTMRFAGVSSFTSQSPTKSTIGSNHKCFVKEISSKTASTDPASSISSTSGEYNFPDNVETPQKESLDKTRPESLPLKCNGNSKIKDFFSGLYEEAGVLLSQQKTDKTGQCISTAKRVDNEMVPHDINPLFTPPSCIAKYVDNVIREVKFEQPVTSQCGAVPLLTAVTEGGPSVMCAKEDEHEDQRQDQLDGAVLKQLKDCLLNEGRFSSTVLSFQTSAPSHAAVEAQNDYPLRCVDMDPAKELYWSEDEGYPLYPTPTSQPGSPYDNVDVDGAGDDGAAQWETDEGRSHCRESTTGEWMFVGDIDNFKQCLETTHYLNIDSECVFRVDNPEYDPFKKSPANPNGQPKTLGTQAPTSSSEKTMDNLAIESCYRETNEFKNKTSSSNTLESSTANQESVLEYHSSRNDILMSLLDKITLLESLVGQTQKSEASRNPQAQTFMDPVSLFLSGQREIMAGQPSHSRLSVNAPVIFPCRPHDCMLNSLQGCCGHCGMCAPRCQGIVHPEVQGPAARGTNIASKASQTDASDGVSQRAARTHSVSTQWQKQEVMCEGSVAGVKQTRQIGCQAEFDLERCQCMQQYMSSIEHLEGIERKLHGEVADLIKSLKRDTEEMVSVGYDRVASLLTAQLNDATSRSQQIFNPLSTDSRTVRLKPELHQEHEPRKALLHLKPGLFQDHEPRKARIARLKSGAAHGLETSLTSAAQQDSP